MFKLYEFEFYVLWYIAHARLVLQLSEKMMGQAQGQELQQLQALHKRLLGQLTQVLSSPNTSSREAAVAVAGIGYLAPPTKRFFGQQVTNPKAVPWRSCVIFDIMWARWALHALLLITFEVLVAA